MLICLYMFYIISVIQSLIRSTRPELDSDSIKKYASLWVTILNFSRQTDLPFSLENRVRVSEVLDVQLVTATSAIIGRLNFTVNENDDSTVDGEKSISFSIAKFLFVHKKSLVSMIKQVVRKILLIVSYSIILLIYSRIYLKLWSQRSGWKIW